MDDFTCSVLAIPDVVSYARLLANSGSGISCFQLMEKIRILLDKSKFKIDEHLSLVYMKHMAQFCLASFMKHEARVIALT